MRGVLKIFSGQVALIGSLLLALAVLNSVPASAQTGDDAYRLSVGDKLRITVFGHDDLSGEFEVNTSGKISIPLVGDISAAGQTANELVTAVVDALQPGYLRNPRVNVELLTYRPFYIIGEVNSPGSYPYTSGMTVISAVAVAGGYTYRARKNRIRIKRGDENERIELEAQDDTLIQPGDIIEVPERFF